jgi:hypothetical protein
MAKRFTDTDKWKRPWFRALSQKAKLVWFYILDNCDHCGVWPAAFDLLAFQSGVKVTREEFEEWFAGKVVRLDEDKYFIPSFVPFQQGELSPAKNAHKPIIAFLDKHGLSLDEPTIPSVSHQEPIPMGPSKGNSKGKGKGNQGGVGGNTDTALDFEALYQKYPRRLNKAEARARFLRIITTPEQYDKLSQAIDRYRAHVLAERTEAKYIKHLSSFLGTEEKQPWQDWLDPSHGTADVAGPDAPIDYAAAIRRDM